MKNYLRVFVIILACLAVIYIAGWEFTYVDISQPALTQSSSYSSRCQAGILSSHFNT